MKQLATLLGNGAKLAKPRSERDELFDYFLAQINPARVRDGFKPLTHGRLGRLLKGKRLRELYRIKSVCNDAEHRGYPWGAIFWIEIKGPKAK